MSKRFDGTILIALCTSAAMMAFAFYQRYATPATVPEVAFYIAAAIICVLPHTLVRQRTCRKNRLNAG